MGHPRSAILRFAAPLALVAILGALLLVIGSSGRVAETASSETKAALAGNPRSSAAQPALIVAAPPARFLDASDRKANPGSTLSLEQARKVATSLTQGEVGDVAVMQTADGPAIIAIHEESKTGSTHFFVLKRRGSVYRVTDRGSLDLPNFHVSRWTAETVDAGGNGHNQVLFTGINRSGKQSAGIRVVLYDPQTRETYSLRIEADPRTGRASRVHWSDNSPMAAAAYRVAIRDKVRAILAEAVRS
jgi:hypothetical protein